MNLPGSLPSIPQIEDWGPYTKSEESTSCITVQPEAAGLANKELLPGTTDSSTRIFKKMRQRSTENVTSSLNPKYVAEGQALECWLGFRKTVDSKELLTYLIKNKVKPVEWIKQHTNPELLAATLTPELLVSSRSDLSGFSSLPFTQEQYLAFAEQGFEVFQYLPNHLKSDDFFIECLKRNPKELKFLKKTGLLLSDPRVQLLSDVFDARDVLVNLPENEWPKHLILEAIKIEPGYFIKKIPEDRSDYLDIMKELISKNASHIKFIPVESITDELVDIAVQGLPACDLRDIPERFLTCKRCQLAIENGNKETLLSFDQYNSGWLKALTNLLEQNPELADLTVNCRFWSSVMPVSLKTEKRVLQHWKYYPSEISGIPNDILKRYQHYWEPAVRRKRNALKCSQTASQRQNRIWLHVRKNPEQLPEEWKQQVLQTRDTYKLPSLSDPAGSQLSISRDALLKPIAPNLISEAPLLFFDQLQAQLLACKPFQLRNAETGKQLQQYIARHHAYFEERLNMGSFSKLNSIPQKAEVYGGRALMVNIPGGCERYKFLRKREALVDFSREEAVHMFYHFEFAGKQLHSELTSEIPKPCNIALIAQEKMPENLLKEFRSELETVYVNNHPYYLCYRFTTKNKDYSTLSHQQDDNGDTSAAEQGLLNAAHDLGVWSSCGAVHTSTIKAFHNFSSHRKQLFLHPLFSARRDFSGGLAYWKSKATNESDWGWSGLRDIGDLEFYPNIDAYTSAKNASFNIPGYAQRCSFLEGFVSNMIAATIHYARLHHEDDDYHYTEDSTVDRMATFLESAINQYLSGLFDKPVKAKHFFEDTSLYSEWLSKTARETIYWTAPQVRGTDCISEHLRNQGRCACSVYPVSDSDTCYYHMDEEINVEALGLVNCYFGLTWLLRGLGLVAGGCAEKLQPQQSESLRL